jgi:formamidopyrimidine-DNA glycosylase
MSGYLHLLLRGEKPGKHDRILLRFTDGSTLAFQDIRKFGRLSLVSDLEVALEHLGVEPLAEDFTSGHLVQLLNGKKRRIKPLLLDQGGIAGLGNIYVDESLWHSGIHPERGAETLDRDEVKSLFRSIRSVLRKAIASRGTDFGDNVAPYGGYAPKVYGREGLPCYRCGEEIEKIVVAQRGTHFCPFCQ